MHISITRVLSTSIGACLVFSISGCATKTYGRQPTLTSYEKTTLTCREIDLEQAKVQGFLDRVDDESSFDGRSVLSFLGDFGVGNVMEKSSAVDSANKRMSQLSSAKSQKGCSYASAAPAQSIAPASAVDATGKSQSQKLEELANTPGLSYDEYQRRYREIKGL